MMIDTRELRIGNLVVIGDKVITMDVRTFHAVIHSFQGYEPEPISLTEEWLFRFWFYEVEESEVYDKEIDGERYISINIKPKKCFVGASVDWTSIKFPESVHQLQNLYHALTGQELKLNDK